VRANNGGLPPWKGDKDLNTQITPTGYHTSGNFDKGRVLPGFSGY
jgi:hypothetical protein